MSTQSSYNKPIIPDSPRLGRRAEFRRGREVQNRSNVLPGGMDLTLCELQDMASRQQQQIEGQQQVLVAKEQRLKYLKQQEQRHSHLSAEQDRLRRLREKVEGQELKLKKLRALRGQVEQHKMTNGNLNSELDSVKALFNEKEKELTVAVAKVEKLTKQLEEIRNGKINGINGETQTAAVLELEKLRKELLHRNKLNAQHSNRLSAQRELLQHRKDDMSQMDSRIVELQQRIKKKKLQKLENQKLNKTRPASNIAAVEPYIQVVPKDMAKDDLLHKFGFEKKDPKYQSMPIGVRTGADEFKSFDRNKEMNNNKDISKAESKLDGKELRESDQLSSKQTPTKFNVANIAAKFSVRQYGSGFPVLRTPATHHQQPVINITEEERQSGSGQSSPASSDSSHNSPSNGSKAGVMNRYLQSNADSYPGKMQTSKLHQNDIKTVHPSPQQSGQPSPPGYRDISTVEAASPNRSPQQNVAPRSTNTLDITDSGKLLFESPLLEKSLPQATSTPVTINSAVTSLVSGINTNNATKPTYQYASKNAIMNTYMGRLGPAAKQRYQQSMNQLYKPTGGDNSSDMKSMPSNNTDTEQRTAFNQPSPVDSSDSNGNPHTHFGLVGLPQYQSIASDKGSYRLNTPKHVRRRQSDSDNEDLSKLLHGGYNWHGANKKINSGVNNSDDAITNSKEDEGTSPSKSSPMPIGGAVAVLRKKTNLKKDKSCKSGNRVSFDPLALLLDASLEGEIDLVRRTAREVADVSAPNDEGITALHNAICAGHYEIVIFLVEFGCDVNSPDSDGWTPLHCAASCNNLPMVKFLVEHGACIFATTISDQETAAEKCEEDEDGYDGCSDYLYSIQEKLGIMNNGEAFAVFDYDATNGDELNFQINNKMLILRKGDEREKEWWWTRLSDKEGYVPRNLLGLYARVLTGK